MNRLIQSNINKKYQNIVEGNKPPKIWNFDTSKFKNTKGKKK